MARIAILLPALASGGAERVMLNLSRGLIDRGLDVDMVLVNAEGAFLTVLDPRVRLVNLEASRVLLALPALVRYLHRENPQAIISSLPHLNLAAVIARNLVRVRSRLVLVEHNNLALNSMHGVRRWERFFPIAIRFLYPFAESIVAVSQGVADGLVKTVGLSRKKIVVIPNPIVTPDIDLLAGEPLDHPWFAPDQPPVILAVGRLHFVKDYPTLLAAFTILHEKRPVRLFILGEGMLLDEMKSLVEQLKITTEVQFAGFDPNPFRFMKRCGVFVLSSIWEGFGNVLVEALACGTQVVSTDCPSGPAEILDNGRFGRLVPIGDTKAMAAAMEDALDRPFPSKCLRERAQIYSVDAALERYLPLLMDKRHGD